MSEIAGALRMMSSRFSTAIQKVTSPGAKAFGKYFIVGSVPGTCHENGRSKIYETEAECLAAILADPWIKSEPNQLIQMDDCSHYKGPR